ncbi:MAG: hypothetical protein MUO77_14545, partial [Anaerolineales bacterium]|nr:hypothetical protein [Anaerolineales bacterium]
QREFSEWANAANFIKTIGEIRQIRAIRVRKWLDGKLQFDTTYFCTTTKNFNNSRYYTIFTDVLSVTVLMKTNNLKNQSQSGLYASSKYKQDNPSAQTFGPASIISCDILSSPPKWIRCTSPSWEM